MNHQPASRRSTFVIILRPLFYVLALGAGAFAAQALDYPNHKALSQQLRKVASAHRKLVRMESVADSLGKREVWLVELGNGKDDERKKRPALLVVAGIEGNDLAGSVSAVAWIESLAENYGKEEAIRKLLDTTTIYVFPRLNPDAAEHFFAKPRVEVAVNNLPTDDDHDGLTDEDGPEDLNGDGLITAMRVADPEGEYILDPSDPRLLLKADRSKGEKGAWRSLSEGIDNDHDEAWNEDGLGGVNFNRNFPYAYRFFGPGAGRHPVSEPETRALADFIVNHPGIGIVFTFGAADNLTQMPKTESAGKRPPTALQEDDATVYRDLGKAWREALGLKKELAPATEPGTFSDWMYFHRGRLSLAARPWSPALARELVKGKAKEAGDKPKEEKEATPETKDETKADTDPPPKKAADKGKPAPDNRNEDERAFLKWIDENAPELFVPWKEFTHPDFPGKKVEIGGFAPFAKSNPPERFLDDLVKKQGRFLTDLAGKFPRLSIRKTEAKPLGDSVYDVTIQVENTGYLPTSLAQGATTREVFSTRLVLKLDNKAFLSGIRTTLLGPIEGNGGMKEVRFVLHAKDRKTIDLEVISMLGGSIQATLELKERR